MADESVKFRFDLDAKEALSSLNTIKDSVLKIGESKNLSGLVSGFTALAGPVLVAGTALMAVKAALDWSKEGAMIERIHEQFSNLASTAGLSGSVLSEGIEKAVGYTADLEDALSSATQAMVKLTGPVANQMPQMFEVARNAGKLFGVETTRAFDMISNAIATGNMRSLRMLGITVDAEQAYLKYAKSIGTTVNALSEQGQQQAILNAVLEINDKKLKKAQQSTESVLTASERLGHAWDNLKDSIALAVNKALGPTFTKVIAAASGEVEKLSTWLTGKFGSDLDQSKARVKKLGDEMQKLGQEMASVKNNGRNFVERIMGFDNYEQMKAKWDKMQNDLIEETKKMQSLEPKTEEKKKEEAIDTKSGGEDKNLALNQKATFDNEILRLTKQRVDSELLIETDAENYRTLQNEQRLLMVQEYAAKEAKIDADARKGNITDQQATDMIFELQAERNAKLAEFDRDREASVIKSFENQQKAAKNASDGIKSSFSLAAAQAKKDMADYGKQGTLAFNLVNSGAQKFFRGIGEGSKDAGQLMKEFLFSVLGDFAEKKGEVLLASGIGTGNGVEIAQGGALIALGAAIKAMAGGGGASSSGGGGGAGASSGIGNQDMSLKPELQEQKKKSVTVQVQGHYFETEQTKTRMLEMIREASDATDFKYQQIGVG